MPSEDCPSDLERSEVVLPTLTFTIPSVFAIYPAQTSYNPVPEQSVMFYRDHWFSNRSVRIGKKMQPV